MRVSRSHGVPSKLSYYFIENIESKSKLSFNPYVNFSVITKHSDYLSRFSREWKTYYITNWSDKKDDNLIHYIDFEDILNAYNLNSKNEENYLSYILYHYTYNYEFLDDKVIPILKKIKSIEMESNLEYYITIPCIIFILKELKNKILT